MKKIIIAFALILMLLITAACGQAAIKDVQLDSVLADIEKAVPMEDAMRLSEADLLPYYGIEADALKQFVVSVNATGIKADEVVMIECADSGDVGEMQEKLDAYLEQKGQQFKNYIPEEYAIIEQCETRVYGDYVVLFVSLEAEEMLRIFESHATG